MELYPFDDNRNSAYQYMQWVDEEGGPIRFLKRSGPEGFPEELQSLAEDLDIILSQFETAYNQYFLSKYGIEY